MLMMIKRSNRGKLSGSLGGKALPDKRKGAQRKRSLWSLITAAVAFALVGLFTFGVGVSYADTQDLSEPVHHKTIEQHLVDGKWDGTYDLKLTVQGDSVGSKETNPVDIVVVLDTSGSMNEPYDQRSSTTKLTMAKQALTNQNGTGLLDKVLGSDGPDGVKVSLVTFADRASTNNPWYNKDNAQGLKDKVGNIRADGGTNWEDALNKAKALLDRDTRSGVQKYVVFLSDGNPTFRLSNGTGYKKNHINAGFQWVKDDNGYWQYVWVDEHDEIVPVTNPDDINNKEGYYDTPEGLHGSGYDTNGLDEYKGCDEKGNPYTYNWNYSCAADVARQFGMDSKHFFSVKIATKAGKMDDLERDATKDSSVPGTSALDGTTPSNLSSAFSDIVTEITHSQTYTNVTIKDALSADAQIVPNTTPTVSKTGGEKALPGENSASVSGSTVTWAIKEDGTHNDLEKGATYTLSINVRPTQSAYDRAMAGKYDTGVTDAGTEGEGIFSNDNANTSLSYSTVKYTNGAAGTPVTHNPLAYEKPVMEIPLSSISVTKVWNPEKAALTSVTVKLQWKNANGSWEDVKDSKENTRTLVLNKDNNWTGDFNDIAAGPDGHEYQVVETDPSDANVWTTSYAYSLKENSYYGNETNKSKVNDGSITLAGRQAQAASATVTNKQNTRKLTITKSVTGNFGDTSKAFSFTLTDASGKAIANVKEVEGTSEGVRLGNNGAFTLKNGQKLVVELPYGASYQVVEHDPKVGTNDTVEYTTSVEASGGSATTDAKERTAKSPTGGITKDTTITYTNKRDVTPDVGVDLGSGAPYAAVFGGAGLAGVIWMVLKRRNSLGI